MSRAVLPTTAFGKKYECAERDGFWTAEAEISLEPRSILIQHIYLLNYSGSGINY
jgi:hypothetical protein